MRKSLSIPRVVCLCLIFGASFARRAAAASKFETFNCQPAAKNGIALQNAHGFPGKDRAVECDYPSAGSCFYDPDVRRMLVISTHPAHALTQYVGGRDPSLPNPRPRIAPITSCKTSLPCKTILRKTIPRPVNGTQHHQHPAKRYRRRQKANPQQQ
ncbi:hypothetical protein C8J57DRAFT_336544 [Mycena rebaudengoi]|nr:hypothetical protein C8J57DRAFT_336544 [Mycena rebaudengoi]